MQTRFKDLDLDEVEDMEEENKDKEGGEDRWNFVWSLSKHLLTIPMVLSKITNIQVFQSSFHPGVEWGLPWRLPRGFGGPFSNIRINILY